MSRSWSQRQRVTVTAHFRSAEFSRWIIGVKIIGLQNLTVVLDNKTLLSLTKEWRRGWNSMYLSGKTWLTSSILTNWNTNKIRILKIDSIDSSSFQPEKNGAMTLLIGSWFSSLTMQSSPS
ncbi:hypothetical protein WICPIJ_000493 [Wickerhamomyces pijperi]|uniref:Uncharacterized protein n=1 Tax=Wickerhamomyces pijperi TaxID=599730 RepID=A0A9P8TQS6_WICPI|nr:hypothetical protein WICPIJ_000493 [Wickerhamomyces pijperi]